MNTTKRQAAKAAGLANGTASAAAAELGRGCSCGPRWESPTPVLRLVMDRRTPARECRGVLEDASGRGRVGMAHFVKPDSV